MDHIGSCNSEKEVISIANNQHRHNAHNQCNKNHDPIRHDKHRRQPNSTVSGNREFKSNVFSMLMEIPEYALETFNGVNDSHYENPSDIVYKRLDRSFSLSLRNDASFFIDMHLNLYGHQSTYNPNLPLRGLIYFTDILKDYIKNENLYGRKQIKLPTPHFVVFYNGTEKRPETEILTLSSAFIHTSDIPELELICRIYNINPENHPRILDKCHILKEYMILVDTINHLIKDGVFLEQAIQQGIDICIQNHVLEEFLCTHKTEVTKIMTLDYTFERQLEFAKKESMEEGHSIGLNEGLSEGHSLGLSEGHSLGLNEGLHALIQTLKNYLATPEEVLAAIIQNPEYKDVTLKQVRKYW